MNITPHMKRLSLRRTVLAVILVAITPVGAALADPFADAKAAYERGDYATALRITRPLANGGDRARPVQPR